jgi:preprotein translocase subunit SecB
MPNEPPSPSPLILHEHHFTAIHLEAAEAEGEEFGSGNLGTSRRFQRHPDNTRRWIVDLRVEFGPAAENIPTPYRGNCSVRGFFEVHENYNHDAERLIRITATSMLYGAAREMIANLTARGPNGLVSLPSVSFFEEPSKKKPAKAAAKKPTRTKKVPAKRGT